MSLVNGASMLVADLKQPRGPNRFTYLPLTNTTASRSEVMKLHGALTEAFLANADALEPALKARREKWKQENRDKRWNALLKPPITSGGRKFVDLWASEPYSKIEKIIHPVNGAPSFEQYDDSSEEGIRSVFYWHFFERQGIVAPGYWMAANGFHIYTASDTQCPELMQFVRANIEGFLSGYKPRKLFQTVRLFNGGELQLPEVYLAAPDVRIGASTLILCLEFSDGELLPLTQAPASEREGVERLRGRLEYVFSGEGEGSSNIVL